MNALVQHRAQRFYDHRADAAQTLCKGIGAKQHHRPRFGLAQRRANSAGMRTDKVELQLTHLVRGNPRAGELPESCVDSVSGPSGGENLFDDGPGGLHAFARVWSEVYVCPCEHQVVQLLEGEIVSGERDGHVREFACVSAWAALRTRRYFSGSDFGRPLWPQTMCLVSPVRRTVRDCCFTHS